MAVDRNFLHETYNRGPLHRWFWQLKAQASFWQEELEMSLFAQVQLDQPEHFGKRKSGAL